MNKLTIFKKFKFEPIKTFFFIFSIYAFLNFLIFKGPQESFNEISDINKLIAIFIVLIYLFFIYRINASLYVHAFTIAFFILAVANIQNITVDYFWNTVPDSRTYASLGSSLLTCGRLALECSEDSYLIFPIGQPIISGLIMKYFYTLGPYINIVLITFTIHVFQKLIKFHTGLNSGLGIFFILIHSLIYELTPLMLSEVTFTFLIILFLYFFFTKPSNKLLSNLIYSFSVLVRPIGIVLAPLIFFYSKSKKKFLFILIALLLTASIFNFLSSNKFLVSEFNIDSQEDGFIENTNYFDYLFKILNFDQTSRKDFFKFLQNNYLRLYGESSKDCSFYEICNVYNPIYNTDGTESAYFKNSTLGNYISKFMISIYKIQSPQGLSILILPAVTMLSLIFYKNKIIIFYSLSTVFLIFPSIITSEYGSRWNYTILFLTGILIELLLAKFKILFKKNVYKS